jgi:hypothetical protein
MLQKEDAGVTTIYEVTSELCMVRQILYVKWGASKKLWRNIYCSRNWIPTSTGMN